MCLFATQLCVTLITVMVIIARLHRRPVWKRKLKQEMGCSKVGQHPPSAATSWVICAMLATTSRVTAVEKVKAEPQWSSFLNINLACLQFFSAFNKVKYETDIPPHILIPFTHIFSSMMINIGNEEPCFFPHLCSAVYNCRLLKTNRRSSFCTAVCVNLLYVNLQSSTLQYTSFTDLFCIHASSLRYQGILLKTKLISKVCGSPLPVFPVISIYTQRL